MPRSNDITVLLKEMRHGKKSSSDKLLTLVYDELRYLAYKYMQNERADHTLQPTALVHEAYVRLVDTKNPNWESRTHFFGFASRVMRQVLIEHARRKNAKKRQGGLQKVVLDETVSFPSLDGRDELDLLEINNAIEALGEIDKRQAEIVELRFFGGLTYEETAEVLGVSSRTIQREWTMAKAWLYRYLKS